MQAVQRVLAHRTAAGCQLGSASHSSSVACRRLASSIGTPFTTRRTRAISICAAKKGNASKSKRKSAAKPKQSTAPPAPPKPTPQPALAPEPVATATLAAAAEPEPAKPTLAPTPPSPPSEPAEPPPPPPPAVAASASSDPIPTHTTTSSDDIPAGGAPVGGSGVAEDRPDTAAEQPSASEAQPAKPAQPRDDLLSTEEIQRLAELKRQQQRGLLPDSNILQGALQEIELITWPTPRKALTDTVLVIAIVAATGVLLFGYNILLSQTAEWWYHTPHPDWLK